MNKCYSKHFVKIFVILAILMLSSISYAQDAHFDINQFNPASDSFGLFTVESSKIHQPFKFGAGFNLHFMGKPLQINHIKNDGTLGADSLVGARLKMDLTFAVAFCRFFQTGFDLPVVLYQSATGMNTLHSPSDAAFGDIRWHNKIVAMNKNDWPLGFAFLVTLIIPSGDDGSYAGNEKVGSEIKFILDGEIGSFLIAGNIGYRIRDNALVSETFKPNGDVLKKQEIDDEFLLAFGVEYKTPITGLSAITEFRGSTLAKDPFGNQFNNPWVMALGARYKGPWGLMFSGALDIGLTPGYGVGPAGFMLGLSWAYEKPDADWDGIDDVKDKCPNEREDRDGFEDDDGCPDNDNDKDNILDKNDNCPDAAEDIDGFKDDDGCPEPDNDEDGILDAADKCPVDAEDIDQDRDEDGCPDIDSDNDGFENPVDKCPFDAEDKDGFEDDDGCPDDDNDADGVKDDVDKCPSEKEDLDNFEDSDGCPEPDNDKDGVLDAKDKCPLEKEIINGNADMDGCPDEGEVMIIDKGDHLELKKQILFQKDSAYLDASSYTILNQVAQVIKAHGKMTKLIIAVHTDALGDATMKQELSQQRAEVIKIYLGVRKIPHSLMELRAMGQTKQIAPNDTEENIAKNNRVEFIIPLAE